jgi:hypothetical protein
MQGDGQETGGRRGTNSHINRRLLLKGASAATLAGTAFVSGVMGADNLSVSGDGLDADPLDCNATVRGELTTEDASNFRTPPYEDDGERGPAYHDAYEIEVVDGTHVTLEMTATSGRTERPSVYLLDAEGESILVAGGGRPDEAGNWRVRNRIRVPSGGTYTIVATSVYAERTFPYELSVTCQSTGELVGERDRIACGDVVSGELTPDDTAGFSLHQPALVHDAYEVEVGEDETVRIGMQIDEAFDRELSDGRSVNPSVSLLDADGLVVGFPQWVSGGASYLRTEVPEEGRYTVLATSSFYEAFFAYELSISCTPVEERPVRSIACGESVRGEVGYGPDPFPVDLAPIDTYQFEGIAGDVATIDLEFDGGALAIQVDGPDGLQHYRSGGELSANLDLPLSLDGTYAIHVSNLARDGPFGYDLSLECDSVDRRPAPSDCRSIECGETAVGSVDDASQTGFIDDDDRYDEYCFDGQCGDCVTLRMNAGPETPALYLVDPNGAIVAQHLGTGMGRGAVIDRYILERTGTYRVVATSPTPGTAFDYTLLMDCEERR